jgi:hypothetical protein
MVHQAFRVRVLPSSNTGLKFLRTGVPNWRLLLTFSFLQYKYICGGKGATGGSFDLVISELYIPYLSCWGCFRGEKGDG